MRPMKYWEIIPDNLSKAGWSWGCIATSDYVSNVERKRTVSIKLFAKLPLLRRERSDDLLKPRIAAQRVPIRMQPQRTIV